MTNNALGGHSGLVRHGGWLVGGICGLPGGFGKGDGCGSTLESGDWFSFSEAAFNKVVGGSDGLGELVDGESVSVAGMDFDDPVFISHHCVF